MPKPGEHHITIYKGRAFDLTLNLKDADGVAKNLTGYTAYAEVRLSESGSVILDLNPTIANATGGVVTISLTGNATANATVGRYSWDLVCDDADGKELPPYVIGRASVEPVITQP